MQYRATLLASYTVTRVQGQHDIMAAKMADLTSWKASIQRQNTSRS